MALTDFFVTFARRKKAQADSAVSGKVDTWTDDTQFQAGASLNNSREMQVAYRNGLANQYTIVVPSSVVLHQNDRIKRVSDGVEFRITSDSGDMHTPAPANLQYAQATAEVIV